MAVARVETTEKKSRRANGEAHQRKDGRWETALFDAERGKWVSVYGSTKKSAQQKAEEKKRELEKGVSLSGSEMKVNALLDLWLTVGLPARSKVKSPNTVANTRWAIELARPAIGAKKVVSLRVEDVERLLARLADRGMARNSVARVRSVLIMVFKFAQRRRIVSWNIAELAEMPAHARPVKEGRSLTVEQAFELLRVAEDHRLGALVTVGVMLGLRPGELCGLRWSDVDLDSGVLHVRQACKRERDEQGREVLVFGDPKTQKSRRSLDMPEPAVAALRRHARMQAAERLKSRTWTDLDLVFCTTVGTPIGPNNLRRDMAELTEKAGIGRWTPKELRHSAGSLLSAKGVPLEQIADLLGHTDTRMLERVYRHPVKSTVSAAAGPMSEMFGQEVV
jgi:integrase